MLLNFQRLLKDFDLEIQSRFYEIVSVAQEVLHQEARFCYFADAGYMLIHPQFMIDRVVTSESVKIYTIEHEDSKDKFRFAIRNCVGTGGF